MSDYQSILSYSGGKDSTAMYLHALEYEVPFRAVFADVGNEHPATLEYVSTIAAMTPYKADLGLTVLYISQWGFHDPQPVVMVAQQSLTLDERVKAMLHWQGEL